MRCGVESIYRVPLKGSTTLAREIVARARTMTPRIQNVSVKHPLVGRVTTQDTCVLTSHADASSTDESYLDDHFAT